MIELIFLMVGIIVVMVVMIVREIRQLRINVENLESAIDDLGAEMMLCVDKNSAEIGLKLEEVKDTQVDNVRGILDKFDGTRGS